FYKWREDRGTRTVIHHVANFEATSTGPDTATCHWFLMLYAADGKPELPSKPPIQIAYMTDHMVKHAEDGWQVSYRKFDNWFVGDTPTTNANLDVMCDAAPGGVPVGMATGCLCRCRAPCPAPRTPFPAFPDAVPGRPGGSARSARRLPRSL